MSEDLWDYVCYSMDLTIKTNKSSTFAMAKITFIHFPNTLSMPPYTFGYYSSPNIRCVLPNITAFLLLLIIAFVYRVYSKCCLWFVVPSQLYTSIWSRKMGGLWWNSSTTTSQDSCKHKTTESRNVFPKAGAKGYHCCKDQHIKKICL